jgi:hypothetical protein
MNFERVVFGFFIILTLSLNYAFVAGGGETAAHHNVWILTFTMIANLFAIGLKLGDRSQTGALLLASGLVAGLLLITARVVWIVAESGGGGCSVARSNGRYRLDRQGSAGREYRRDGYSGG